MFSAVHEKLEGSPASREVGEVIVTLDAGSGNLFFSQVYTKLTVRILL